MAYGGGFNPGSGASSYDLGRLAASVISGNVSAPLMTVDGIRISTDSGEEIGAFFSRSAELQGIYDEISAVTAEISQRMETIREECLWSQYALAADYIRGDVSAPLATAEGKPIQDSNGNLLFAHRVREDDRAYADAAIAAAVQPIIVGIISGQVSAPMETASGIGIMNDSGTSIAAIKNL